MLRPPSRLSLAAAILAAILIACSGRVQPPSPQPMGATDFRLTSAEFVAEYNANQATFQNKYRDKVVELTGKLASVGNDKDGQGFFYLIGPEPAKIDKAVCHMDGALPWRKATPGQTVTLKGRGSAFLVPRLDNCEVLDVKGPPAPRLSADEFAARAFDKELMKRKDRPRYLVVHGTIEKLAGRPNTTGLFLVTQNKDRKVLIHFSPREFERLNVASWKPGQRIEVIGGDSTNPGGWGWLVECLLMDDPK
jgi:hypothetical protein